jgi:hypothetical protein
MIFNRLNFHGHLRLSGVCTRWKHLIENDFLFMNTVSFVGFSRNSREANGFRFPTLLRSYKHIDLRYQDYGGPWKIVFGESFQQLLKTVETIRFGSSTRTIVNLAMPLCLNLKEVQFNRFYNPYDDNDDAVLTFNHTLPVKISDTTNTEFLDRFDVITEISQMVFDTEPRTAPTEEFIAKYGGVKKSLSVRFDGKLGAWSRFENLQLQYLNLSGPSYRPFDDGLKNEAALQTFFKLQAPFLKAIKIDEKVSDFAFDPMRMLLRNLERIVIAGNLTLELRLNDLKVLPKLRSLEYTIKESSDDGEYYLDVAELNTLVELRIEMSRHLVPGPILHIVSGNQPLDAMLKFDIRQFQFDIMTLEQIAQTMPQLKKLTFKSFVIHDNTVIYNLFSSNSFPTTFQYEQNAVDFSSEAAAQLNKLNHLECLRVLTQHILNSACMEKLSLPELRDLVVQTDRHPVTINGEYNSISCTLSPVEKKIFISQTTLDMLAKNCPKLLRLSGVDFVMFSSNNSFILAQRLNAATKFRRVRPIENKTVDGNCLKFDYDSVESCSSDEGY